MDVVVCHGPPLGVRRSGPRSSALTDTIEDLQPPLVVVGHIHPGYGALPARGTEIINAAYVDNDYKPANPLVEIEL